MSTTEASRTFQSELGSSCVGGSAASMGPGGLVSNQSGFDVY